MKFKVKYKTLTPKERLTMITKTLYKYPGGLTLGQLSKEAGCGRNFARKSIKKLGNKIWCRYLGARNLCLYYSLTHARKLSGKK